MNQNSKPDLPRYTPEWRILLEALVQRRDELIAWQASEALADRASGHSIVSEMIHEADCAVLHAQRVAAWMESLRQ